MHSATATAKRPRHYRYSFTSFDKAPNKEQRQIDAAEIKEQMEDFLPATLKELLEYDEWDEIYLAYVSYPNAAAMADFAAMQDHAAIAAFAAWVTTPAPLLLNGVKVF